MQQQPLFPVFDAPASKPIEEEKARPKPPTSKSWTQIGSSFLKEGETRRKPNEKEKSVYFNLGKRMRAADFFEDDVGEAIPNSESEKVKVAKDKTKSKEKKHKHKHKHKKEKRRILNDEANEWQLSLLDDKRLDDLIAKYEPPPRGIPVSRDRK
jgi:hypothetical protein